MEDFFVFAIEGPEGGKAVSNAASMIEMLRLGRKRVR